MPLSPARSSLIRAGLACAAAAAVAPFAPSYAQPGAASARPNIVLISADDLGWADLGVFGQQMIQTPELDAMAAAGLLFTSAYAGSTVCTPSRAALLTGMHGGHARLRSNARESLQPEDVTIGEIMQNAGYVTGAFGKWGVSGVASPTNVGNPNVQGFEHFFGYLDNTEAKDYFPERLWQTQAGSTALAQTELSDSANGGKGEYGPDAVHDRAIQFIRDHHEQPFFLYYASIAPHAATSGHQVTSIDPAYQNKNWDQDEKEHATKITDLDAKVGSLLDELAVQNLMQNTIVIFTADNGPHGEGGHKAQFFDSNGPLQGIKRSMHDGGIRVPTIAWGPGYIPAGDVSDLPWAHWDLMATLAELADAPMAGGTNSVSLAPTLLGTDDQSDLFNSRPMFWRDEADNNRGLRLGDLKAVGSVNNGKVTSIELFDLSTDIGESNNLANDPAYAEEVQQMLQLINEMHGDVRVATPPVPVPEPASALLLSIGVLAVAARRR